MGCCTSKKKGAASKAMEQQMKAMGVDPNSKEAKEAMKMVGPMMEGLDDLMKAMGPDAQKEFETQMKAMQQANN